MVTDLWTVPADWGGAAYIYRAASAAELDPVVVAVRVAGDAAPLAPRVAALARQVDAGLQLRDIATLQRERRTGSRRMASAASSSAAFCSWRWSSPLPACTRSWPSPWRVAPARSGSVSHSAPTPGACSRSVFARAGRQLGGGIIAGNSLILLLAWRADSLTADLLVSSVITSVIMAVVGVLACAAPARRALRVQPTEALRQV